MEQETFMQLKCQFLQALFLLTPTCCKPFQVSTDTLLTAINAVLEQEDEDGQLQLCAFYSHILLAAKHNYDCELLAVIEALCHLHAYLMNTLHIIDLYTDHKNLLYFKDPH